MKKVLLTATVITILVACSKTKTNSSTPTTSNPQVYLLREVLADPGNGSGTFVPVSSNRTISLYADGTIKSNGDLCSFSPNANTPSSGMYSYADSTITMSGCTLHFTQTANQIIINYFCIEPCMAKYEMPLVIQ